MPKFLRNNQGISLIEVVMAVSLLLIVVMALVRLGLTTVKTSDSARTRSVSQQLADEILDIARYVRDSDPNTFFGLSTSTNYKWNSTAEAFETTTCDATDLNQISVDCRIEVSINGTDIPFYRIIEFTGSATARTVTVYVYWNNEGAYSNVITSTILTRWRD